MPFSLGRWRQFTTTYANAPLATSDIDPPHKPELLDAGRCEALSPRRIRLNICIAAAVFVVAALVALFPDSFDRPVVQSFNQLVGRSKLFDRLVLSVFWYPTYAGAHYPSDLIGGAALGTIAIWAVQRPKIFSLCSPALQWEKRSPSIFYATAFFLSYQVATLFGDLRWTASLILRP